MCKEMGLISIFYNSFIYLICVYFKRGVLLRKCNTIFHAVGFGLYWPKGKVAISEIICFTKITFIYEMNIMNTGK